MSYPPPPGLKTSPSSSSSPHPSLPARPPPSTTSSNFRPAFSAPSNSTADHRYTAPNATGYNGAGNAWSTHSPASAVGLSRPPAQNHNAYRYQQQSYGQQASQFPAQPTLPQIHNPFPLPGDNNNNNNNVNAQYDAEEAAQIAQWQSTYNPSENQTVAKPGPGPNAGGVIKNGDASTKQDHMANTGGTASTKQKTVFRSGGGKTWQDDTLLEWDPAHFRLQIGNLAGEVTDESLLKAFSQYQSVQKARVIRDKRTTKSKGYGFVSFSEGDDYFNAFREMKNKYIGSHPVTIQPCKTKIQAAEIPDKTRKNKNNKHTSATSSGQANTGAGVQKKQPKTKGGLKLLG